MTTGDNPQRSPQSDDETADGFMGVAFKMARQRATDNDSYGGDIFTVQEAILVALYYLLRSRFPRYWEKNDQRA